MNKHIDSQLILVVEDDRPVRGLITTALEMHDYRFEAVDSGKTAVMNAASHNPDLIMLDLGLPDMDGIEVIEKIRSWSTVPIIVISARTEDADKIAALDAGADDYLTKPFSLEELSARIRVLIRRSGVERVDNTIKVGPLTLDTDKKTAVRDGKEISLTAKEYSILEYLMHNKGIVLSREKIQHHIWNYDYEGSSNIIDVYIRTLRNKVDAGFDQKLIRTVRGLGYVIKEDDQQ